jgi:hypothetical protein
VKSSGSPAATGHFFDITAVIAQTAPAATARRLPLRLVSSQGATMSVRPGEGQPDRDPLGAAHALADEEVREHDHPEGHREDQHRGLAGAGLEQREVRERDEERHLQQAQHDRPCATSAGAASVPRSFTIAKRRAQPMATRSAAKSNGCAWRSAIFITTHE